MPFHCFRPSRSVLGFAALVALVGAEPALAQSRTPGAPGGDGRGASAFLAEYYAEVFSRAEEITGEWRRAWREDDLDELLELYLDDAQIVFSDAETIAGIRSIEEFLTSNLPEMGELVTSVLDFDASGRMAFLSGTFHLDRTLPGGGTERITGRYHTVILNRERSWGIRSQVFSVEGSERLPPD